MHVLKGPLSTFSSKKLFPGSTYINAKNIALAYLGGSVVKNHTANAEAGFESTKSQEVTHKLSNYIGTITPHPAL